MKLSKNGKATTFLGASFLIFAVLCINNGKSKLGACCIIVVSGCALMLYAISGRRK